MELDFVSDPWTEEKLWSMFRLMDKFQFALRADQISVFKKKYLKKRTFYRTYQLVHGRACFIFYHHYFSNR